jgi:undecaprenyl-diphosphatase
VEPLDHLFVALSWIGSFGLVWIAIAIVVAAATRRPGLLLAVLLSDLAADLSASGLKQLFDRPRPPLRYPEPEPLVSVPGTPAFPSGHAATSFACAVVLAGAVPRLSGPLLVLAALIAWSRVYVGVHYPLDAIAGAILGTAVGLAVRALLRREEGPRRSLRSPRSG